MYFLLKLFFDICLFQKGPQDIPVSSALLLMLIPVYALISFLILILSTDFFNAILQVMVEIVLVLTACKLILYLARKTARYQQTACALIASDAVISFIALPAMATLIGQGTALAFFTVVALMLWHWIITGHIYSKALEKSFSFGLGVAFLYILFSYQLMALIFPEIISQQ